MKKKLIGVLLCSALLLAGCGNSNTDTASSEVSEASSVPVAAESEVTSVPETFVDAPTNEETTETAEDFSIFLTLADYKNRQIEADEDTVAEEGFTLNIDYVGTIDGVAFDGGTGNYDLLLGSGSFIDGFEDQLIGHKVGDVVDVVCTFPEDYGVEELNGKEAHFETTINAIYVQTIDEVFASIVDESEIISYPQDVVDKWTEDFKSMYQEYADEEGVSVEDYMESIGYTADMLDTNVKTFTQRELVAKAILKEEGITTDSDAYKEASENVPTQFGNITAETALSYGYTETQVEYLTLYQAALTVISQYAA